MTFRLLRLPHLPIAEQLHLEEILLREEKENYILLNTASSPAIVLGISNKEHELVHIDKLPPHIPLIRRFSGGGCVVIDQETVFITLICNKADHPFPPYPEPILRFAHSLLKSSIPNLELRENDFTLQDRKCGGNALYIKKDRWLIHTSLLWDYTDEHMSLLKHPPKAPTYRVDRSHADFLCKLRDYFPCKKQWMDQLATSALSRLKIGMGRPLK